MENQTNDTILDDNHYEQENNRVGFGRRLGAYLLDILFTILAGIMLGSFIGEALVSVFGQQDQEAIDNMSTVYRDLGLDIDIETLMNTITQTGVSASLIGILLFVLEGISGQSIGKMLLNIHNTDVDGNPAGPAKLWLRAALKYGSNMASILGGLVGISLIALLGSLWGIVIFFGCFAVLGSGKQALHDIMAKTVVSYKK